MSEPKRPYYDPNKKSQVAKNIASQFAWCVSSIIEVGAETVEWGVAQIINNDGSKSNTKKKQSGRYRD